MFVHGTLQSYHLLLLKQVLHFRDEKYGRNEPTNRGKMFFLVLLFFLKKRSWLMLHVQAKQCIGL